jgi:P-type Ca2+ transporter type 2C
LARLALNGISRIPIDWVEGITILVAVLIVVGVGPINDWQKEKLLDSEALNKKREDRFVKALRDCREHLIHIPDIVMGDVVLIKPGDVIPRNPCDRAFLSGHNVRSDESNTTGESDAIKKLSARS